MTAKKILRRNRVASNDVLERAIKKAFRLGQLWGVTYSGWFIPTGEQHAAEFKAALKKVKRILRSNAKVSRAND